MDLLRISTAGSVDDGKSTLIGRLLYDNNALTQEQQDLVERKTKEKGLPDLDFSVITDGLIAEREQGITIDVAHIYFSTDKRKFIIADSPGHIEYTRNMVTGASHAEISIILIDARKGLLEQSFRHFFISQLLQLHTIVFCINKMDLVNYEENIYLNIETQIKKMLNLYRNKNNLSKIKIIPISSLKGDNVVFRSEKMKWYKGDTLNHILHELKNDFHNTSKQFRMDVQNVLHVQNESFKDYRGYSGKIASGSIQVGDKIIVLPSQKEAIISEIRKYKNMLSVAYKGDSINISLDRELDISRGNVIVKKGEAPEAKNIFTATIVWLENSDANLSNKYIIQCGSRNSQAKLKHIHFIIPPETPTQKIESETLKLNDIASVEIQSATPLFLDTYQINKENGAFIFINPITNNTCAVGFVN